MDYSKPSVLTKVKSTNCVLNLDRHLANHWTKFRVAPPITQYVAPCGPFDWKLKIELLDTHALLFFCHQPVYKIINSL